MWSKKGQPVSNRAQLGSKWLKTVSTRVKMGQMAPKGSHAAQRGQNNLKIASNTPKWPFPGQIWVSPRGEGPPSTPSWVPLALGPLRDRLDD